MLGWRSPKLVSGMQGPAAELCLSTLGIQEFKIRLDRSRMFNHGLLEPAMVLASAAARGKSGQSVMCFRLVKFVAVSQKCVGRGNGG